MVINESIFLWPIRWYCEYEMVRITFLSLTFLDQVLKISVYCGRKFSLKTVLMLAELMVITYFYLVIACCSLCFAMFLTVIELLFFWVSLVLFFIFLFRESSCIIFGLKSCVRYKIFVSPPPHFHPNLYMLSIFFLNLLYFSGLYYWFWTCKKISGPHDKSAYTLDPCLKSGVYFVSDFCSGWSNHVKCIFYPYFHLIWFS